MSPASSASVAMNHRAGGQHLRSRGQVGSARCRTQGHDGGQVAEFLTKQEGVKFALRDDQRCAGLDDGGVGDRSRAGRGTLPRTSASLALGLADLHQRQPVPVEPRDNHPSGLKAAVPFPGREHHAGRPPQAGGLDRLIRSDRDRGDRPGPRSPRASRAGPRPRSRGPRHRPGASRTVPLAGGLGASRACWRSRLLAVAGLGAGRGRPEGSHDAGQFGHDPHGLGECHPVIAASPARGIASPRLQGQHFHGLRSGSTSKDG